MHTRRLASTAILYVLALAPLRASGEEATLLLKQARDGLPAENLTAAEFAQLGDPFFSLVLRQNADALTLTEIERRIQPDVTKRRTFVVHERILDPSKGQPRRAVLAYEGSNAGEVLTGNVALSVFFDSNGVKDRPPFVEAWGWDTHRGRYNYYKLDNSGTPDLRMSWKFRGSSDEADLLSATDRPGTCMACHVNGAPVMKELAIPWNNWHSFESLAHYLTGEAADEDRWPAASDPTIQGRLRGAEDLELRLILPAVTQFNTRRINRALRRREANGDVDVRPDGMVEVVEGRRLLRHLFLTTEFNIISARQASNMFPLRGVQPRGPAADVQIPDTFFLNASLLAGGGPANYRGLGISDARTFSTFATVTPAEYVQLVNESGQRLGGRPGDVGFAWFVPEASHADNSMIDRMLQRGIVTPHFVAAVMAIDLERPVLSPERALLMQFIPDRFMFQPIDGDGVVAAPNARPDDLTEKVIAALQAVSPPPGTPAARFLERLSSEDAVALLKADVESYANRIKERLANANTRPAELSRLFSLAAERRRAVLNDPVLGNLQESALLFPLND